MAKAFVGSNPTPRTRSHCLVPTDLGCPKDRAPSRCIAGLAGVSSRLGNGSARGLIVQKKGSYGVELIGVAVVVSVVAVRVPADVTSGVAVGPGWTIWTACG